MKLLIQTGDLNGFSYITSNMQSVIKIIEYDNELNSKNALLNYQFVNFIQTQNVMFSLRNCFIYNMFLFEQIFLHLIEYDIEKFDIEFQKLNYIWNSFSVDQTFKNVQNFYDNRDFNLFKDYTIEFKFIYSYFFEFILVKLQSLL